MPRPNPNRNLHSETNLARRIAHEREARKMTYDGLADRMTRLGCAIQSSAIYKIEKADPPRRITVEELVAFSQVFGIPVQELLVPLELIEQAALQKLLTRWDEAQRAKVAAVAAEKAALEELQQHLAERPDLEPTLRSFVRAWVEQWSESPDAAEALWMYTFTESPDWSDALDVALDKKRAKRKAKANG